MEYRDESKRLDQCSRLYDSSVSNEGFELDASQIIQVFTSVFVLPIIGVWCVKISEWHCL